MQSSADLRPVRRRARDVHREFSNFFSKRLVEFRESGTFRGEGPPDAIDLDGTEQFELFRRFEREYVMPRCGRTRGIPSVPRL